MAFKLISDFVGVALEGVQVPVKQGTLTVNLGGVTNEPQLGPGGVVLGSTQQSVEGTIAFTSGVAEGTDLKTTYNLRDGQISLTDDRGGEWLMTGATIRTPVEFSAGAGDLAVEYFGDEIVQIPS